MRNCLCVNADKEEFLCFDKPSEDIREGSPVSNTLEYLIATEWARDQILFIFEGGSVDGKLRKQDNPYKYVLENYTERMTLKRAPKFSFVVNIAAKEFYTTAALLQGIDGIRTCPLLFLLMSRDDIEISEMFFNEQEERQVGAWHMEPIMATNKKAGIEYMSMQPVFKCDGTALKPLSGCNIVVTGTVSGYTRTEIENFIREHGGNPQRTVTKRTDYLLVADNPGRKKVEDAKKYGITIISEKNFFDLI